MEKTIHRKQFKGVVVRSAVHKTAVVLVERYVKHPRYKKYMRVSKKYKTHDPENTLKVGDKVLIEECRPISKDKHFKIASAQ
ncbi:MAG: 30S ribosomal protein S17 [Parcubacteria group bacterium]|nr:30S ribosomal protein S17 [Parcubacteria group bacterium]